MIKNKNIFIRNIYYMLSYAFKSLNQSEYENIATEDFDNIHNLFAAILSRGIGIQLKQGIYREYINRIEDLPVMRGKINIQKSVRNRIEHKQLLTCEYDELSENNILNQILKTTVTLLLRCRNMKTEYKDIMKKQMLYFSGVEKTDLNNVRWSSLRFHRNNQTYRMLISICQLIAEGMLLSTEKGEHRLASFIDDQQMCHLYEKFLLEYYIKHFPDLSVSASQISGYLMTV